MIRRWSSKGVEVEADAPRGFDDFELRLGDVMRGERATMGKSLLDVQRELRIKASYIAAIENADPDAFDTPGFIAGYVRSYARYLSMDPDKAFATFCLESGFSVAHGMSAKASVIKKPTFEERSRKRPAEGDIFGRGAMPFTPIGDSLLSRIEPAAVGSVLVLVGLIGAIGFGGWTVLQEVQRVQVAPVDQTPLVLSDLDPLDGAMAAVSAAASDSDAPNIMQTPRAEALDRLYRPQALDVPVLVARDAPIATIDPRSIGNFATAETTVVADESLQVAGIDAALVEAVKSVSVPQVLEGAPASLRMVAAYPSWVRVRAADGTVIFEGVMNKGDSWEVPATEEPPTLRTGESGAIYFAMGNEFYGPVGPRGAVTSNVPLHREKLAELYVPAEPEGNEVLATMMAELQNAAAAEAPLGE